MSSGLENDTMKRIQNLPFESVEKPLGEGRQGLSDNMTN
jgi:hypothetical protein